MLNRRVNFYIAALLITLVGSFATISITRTALNADVSDYGTGSPQQVSGEVPTLNEALVPIAEQD